jgi:cytochrome c oxidase cbb3-type subunit I
MSNETKQNSEKDAILRSAIDRSLRHPVMFFFTSGAAWLAVAILLGIITTVKFVFPTFFDGCSWLTQGRVFAAHLSVLIYGWAFQAGFGALIWLIARLTRQESRASGIILFAGHLWNFIIALGLIGILSGYGSGVLWMEFPNFVWPAMLIVYVMITVWTAIQFRVSIPSSIFISQWFAISALIWLPWILITAYLFIFCIGGNPLMSAAINTWYRSGIVNLFFIPIAASLAYYLVPKVIGRAVHSYSLSLIGFWSLAIIGPWAGMQKMAGAPIPYFLPYLGAAAGVLLCVPAIAIASSTLRTMFSDMKIMIASPSLRFTAAGMICLLLYGIFSSLINLPGSTLQWTQFSITNYGMDILAIYGCFSFVMFGAIYFIVPRITRREWLSKRLINLHFNFSMYGVITIAVFAILGGILQGIGIEKFNKPWENAVTFANPYTTAAAVAWCFVLFSNVFFFLHLLLMWMRLGRRSSHPTLLVNEHTHEDIHGPEGDIDNAGPGSIIAH